MTPARFLFWLRRTRGGRFGNEIAETSPNHHKLPLASLSGRVARADGAAGLLPDS